MTKLRYKLQLDSYQFIFYETEVPTLSGKVHLKWILLMFKALFVHYIYSSSHFSVLMHRSLQMFCLWTIVLNVNQEMHCGRITFRTCCFHLKIGEIKNKVSSQTVYGNLKSGYMWKLCNSVAKILRRSSVYKVEW